MNDKNDSWDNLQELTKVEIIEFLKTQYHYRLPSNRDIKSFKWNKESIRLQKKMDDHLSNQIDPELIKKRDSYAIAFNKTNDANEQMKLFAKMKPIDDLIADNIKEYKAIAREQKKNDKYLKSI